MAKKTSSLEQFKAFMEELRGPEIKPVYAFFGEESFFPDRLQDAAISVVPEEARDFNLDVLYGLEVKADKVIDVCRSYPMMAERRVVVVRDFMKMFDARQTRTERQGAERPGGGHSGLEQASADPGEISLDGPETGGGTVDDLANYLKQPNPSTLLILTSEKRPAANSKLGSALKKSKTVTSHTFDPLGEYHLPQWIVDWASMEHNLTFEDNAVQLLAFHVGNHLQQLTVEIAKLAASCKGDRAVKEQDVKDLVGLSREYSIFDFQDALFERNTGKAMMIARQLLHNADSPAGEVIKVISYLYGTFGKIWHIQRLTRKGMSPNLVQESVGIKSNFYYNKLARAGYNYPLAVCPWLFEVLLDADKAIKGFSRQSPESVLLMTVKKITT